MSPENLDALLASEHRRMWRCDWNDWNTRKAKVLSALTAAAHGTAPAGTFPLCYLPIQISTDLFSALAQRRLASAKKPAQQTRQAAKQARATPRKIGVLSIDFRSHSAGLSLLPLFKALDRNKFELYAYNFSDLPLNNAFDHIVDARSLSHTELVTKIKADGIDLLIDTTRHILGAPAEVMELRPAPSSLSAWGYGETTGSTQVDSFLCDDVLMGGDSAHFTENPVRIPHYHPIPPLKAPPIAPATKQQLGWPANGVFMGHFNALYKLTPELFSIWLDILGDVPHSYLVLRCEEADTKAHLLKAAEHRGIIENRLIFVNKQPHGEHLKRVGALDLVLDNPFFGGGSSAVDALYAGVPAITFDGGAMQSRSGLSIFSQFGLNEYCAHTPDNAYKTLIVDLLSNPKQRTAAQQKFISARNNIPQLWLDYVQSVQGAFTA